MSGREPQHPTSGKRMVELAWPKSISGLAGKLANRTFLLFVLCALLPLAATGLITIQQTTRYLTEQTNVSLTRSAKSNGMQLYERLTLAQRVLRHSSLPQLQRLALETMNEEGRYFDSIAELDNGVPRPLAGEFDAAIDTRGWSESGAGPLLKVIARDGKAAAVYMLERNVADGTPRVLIGRLDAGHLWQPVKESSLYEMCVRNADGIVLYCSGNYQHGVSQNGYLSAEWSLFMRAAFGVDDWTIGTRQEKSLALAGVIAYKRMLSMAMAAVLAFVALLSAVSIRRSHRPLEKMIGAIRRVANGEFDRPVHIDSGDEYQELALAFNSMSRQLGLQFRTLNALGQIDRCILDSCNVESVIEAILDKTRGLLDCKLSAVALFDTESESLGRVFVLSNGGDRIGLSRMTWPTMNLLRNGNEQDGYLIERNESGVTALQALWDSDAGLCLVMPASTRTRLRAMYMVGFESGTVPTDTQRRLARDFTDRLAVALTSAEREQDLFHQAHYDALTQLPNRLLFKDRLEQELAHARRNGERVALLFLDLDRFKIINDSVGHTAGDLLLKVASTRLVAELREIDTLARLGGDEFTIIVPQVSNPNSVPQLCERLLRCLKEPFVLAGQEFFIGASIGVAIYPDNGSTAEDLLRNSDTAMYRAKQHARGSYAFHEESMNQQARRRIALEVELRRALINRQFTLHYQPKVDLRTMQIVGAEALLRWRHPERGLVNPGEFISVAEDFGLIVPIGEWILQSACRQFDVWRSHGLPLRSIAVNVSIPQIASPQFVDFVANVLREHGMIEGQLELEITESTLAGDIQAIAGRLEALRNAGATLAIDDFGTGYSSLSYLQRLPIQVIKIDRSFMPQSLRREDTVMCAAVIAMARALGKDVVAEGIETASQLMYLQEQGCTVGQGFYFNEPMTAEALTDRLLSQLHAGTTEKSSQAIS
jgi:diguanylate cyclase (GGDEF)-like protein